MCSRGGWIRPEIAQAVAEGLTLAEFDAGLQDSELRAGADHRVDAGHAEQSPEAALARAADRGRVLGECTNIARELANEPSNTLTPSVFADRAAAIARDGGLPVEVLDEKALAKLGMGMLLGVGQGSHEPPGLVVIRLRACRCARSSGAGPGGQGHHVRHGRHLHQAGRRHGAHERRHGGRRRGRRSDARDCGAEGAHHALSGSIPDRGEHAGRPRIQARRCVEERFGQNRRGVEHRCRRPADSGRRAWYAQKIGATHLVDIATLTGAISVALGKFTSGLFGTPPGVGRTRAADAERAEIAAGPCRSTTNTGICSRATSPTGEHGRPYGGAITAALFLKEFTGGLPWAHMDIAGTAWVEDVRPYLPEGSGRYRDPHLAELAFTSDTWPV